jgi:uncharacterized metal-binding protein
MANEAALRFREAGKRNMYCTAGIGGHVKGLVDGARSAKLLVGIDGCSVGCVMKRKWQRCSACCARGSRGS